MASLLSTPRGLRERGNPEAGGWRATGGVGYTATGCAKPIRVDGTGRCGACGVGVGGQTRFACVDGTEFDGHLVDFDGAMKRQQM